MTLEQANAVLHQFAPRVSLSMTGNRVYAAWVSEWAKPPVTNRYWWNPKEGSDYPSCYKRLPFGGTCTRATNQIVRRLKGKPVIPLGSFLYLVEGPAKLGQQHGTPSAFRAALVAAGWPEEVPCVLCGAMIRHTGDWWTIGEKKNRRSGPSCSMRDCRKEGRK